MEADICFEKQRPLELKHVRISTGPQLKTEIQLYSQGQAGGKKQDVVHRQPLIHGGYRVPFFFLRPSVSVNNSTAFTAQFLCSNVSEGVHL